jgi:hypothetical protein
MKVYPGIFYEFRFDNGARIIWDIGKAEAILSDTANRNRFSCTKYADLIGMPREQMALLFEWDIDQQKLEKADCSKPGICAPIKHYGDDHESLILIDGVHRAVKAYIEHKQFFLRSLNPEESKRCIVFADDWSRIPGWLI